MHTSPPTTGARALLAILAVLALTAAACGGGTTDVPEAAVDEAPTAESDGDPTAAPEPTSTAEPEPTAAPEPQLVSWADGLEVGSCFTEAEGDGGAFLVDEIVSCDEPHDAEVFVMGVAPDAPGTPYSQDDLYDYTGDTYCGDASREYFGITQNLLPFPTFSWVPPEDDWDAGDRVVLCAASPAPDDNDYQLVGSARSGTLTSDEAIVSRVIVGGARDWYFSTQHSDIAPLTDGSFDLQQVSVDVRLSGFDFGGPLADGSETGNAVYNYRYESGEITTLITGLDGWEKASPHLLLDPPAFMFAARETESDDWDIYLSTSDDGAVALTDNPGNDRWPTLTPDEGQIVYHATTDGVGSIWVMDTDGGNKTQLTDDAGTEYESAVSPDGSKVVFASDRAGNDDVWMMDIDGANQVNLTNHPANEAWPFWSEDGSMLYFQTDRFGAVAHIMIMELDGSNQSIFSDEIMTNGQVLPALVVERHFQNPVFLGDEPSTGNDTTSSTYDVVPGADGEYGQLVHSTGRITVSLPSGWEHSERSSGFEGIVAAQSLDTFENTWAHDGVVISLIETDDLAEWDAIVAGVDVVTGCDFDDQAGDISGPDVTYERFYTCGEVRVLLHARWNADAGVGIIVEAQGDSQPTEAADRAIWDAIIGSLSWE